jgi:thioredoxin reductase (NADPH)
MYDIIVVGAGPAGLTAGIFARTRKMNTLIIDADKAGGQLLSLYPTKVLYDYPAFQKIRASDLAKKFVDHAINEGCELREEEAVTDLISNEESLEVVTEKGTYETKTVILSIGMGLFEPRKLGVKGEDEFADKGLYYKIPDKAPFDSKRVLFIGGGDSALEMALSVVDVAKEVTLIHRKGEFRAMEANVEDINNSSINVKFFHECKEITGDDVIRGAVLVNNQTKEETKMDLDAVVINIGFSPKLGRAKEWGIDLKGNAIKVTPDMRTSKKGVFACGDIVDYEGKNKRIITGCGEACTAAISAYKYIKKPYWA